MGSRDFRSDTVTFPTEEMRRAMYDADVGDDVCGDDPTVNKLEKISAEITGKESALFVPSGTFGNQLSILTHTTSGHEIILSEQAHAIKHEAGSISLISSVQTVTVDTKGSYLTLSDIDHRIRDKDIHYPVTDLVCLENALSNGTVMPIDEMRSIYDLCHKNSVSVHLDGARLFNASVKMGVDASEICSYTDSVTFCLSKGLCSPVGSVVCGSKDFIDEARYNRKKMGGGMRQAGVIAAPGIVALNTMVERLHEDHDRAETLGNELSKFECIDIDLDKVQINMLFFSLNDKTRCTNEELVNKLQSKGFKLYPPEDGLIRFVTNYWTDDDDIKDIINEISSILDS